MEIHVSKLVQFKRCWYKRQIFSKSKNSVIQYRTQTLKPSKGRKMWDISRLLTSRAIPSTYRVGAASWGRNIHWWLEWLRLGGRQSLRSSGHLNITRWNLTLYLSRRSLQQENTSIRRSDILSSYCRWGCAREKLSQIPLTSKALKPTDLLSVSWDAQVALL